MSIVIQVRRDTTVNWTAADPVINQGEIALDLTDMSVKFGDGATAWSLLPLFTSSVASGTPTLTEIKQAVITSADDVDKILVIQGGVDKELTKANFTKELNLVKYYESSNDAGSFASGTVTLDVDTNGNSHEMTITGAVTMAQPTATLTGSQFISGSIEINGWDANIITWSAANWDWGDAGEPATKTARMLVWFYRKAGDTKTLVGLGGGFS